jgi:hypothetical protein
MYTAGDLWLLTALLRLSLPWPIAYLMSGTTSLTRLASPKRPIRKSFMLWAKEDVLAYQPTVPI